MLSRTLASFATAGFLVGRAACQTTEEVPPTPMESARDGGWSYYGFDGEQGGDTIALGAMPGDEANVIVTGTITEVCAKKGCWMNVMDGDDEIFVRFRDYEFFVPRNAAGHDVAMHGTASTQVTSVEELRHYAKDAGKSQAEIEAITEPEVRIVFLADSVYIHGEGLDEPHSQ